MDRDGTASGTLAERGLQRVPKNKAGHPSPRGSGFSASESSGIAADKMVTGRWELWPTGRGSWDRATGRGSVGARLLTSE